jgi:hypothetical protein
MAGVSKDGRSAAVGESTIAPSQHCLSYPIAHAEPKLGWRVDLHPSMRGRQLLHGNHSPFGRGASKRARARADS